MGVVDVLEILAEILLAVNLTSFDHLECQRFYCILVNKFWTGPLRISCYTSRPIFWGGGMDGNIALDLKFFRPFF